MNNNIDLVVTFYKYEESQIKYWLNLSNKIKSKINVYFAVDSIWTKKQKDFLFKKNTNVFWNTRNTGKLKLVELFVKKNYDKLANFIKICDPDDEIDLNELMIFESKLSSLDKDSTIIINSNVKKKNKNKIFFIKTLTNFNTVFPKKMFLQTIFDLPEISKSSDTIMGFVSTTINPNITVINNSFYIYNYQNGITKISKLSQKELNKYFNELNEVFSFYKKYSKYNNNREYNCTPSHMTYVWAKKAINNMQTFKSTKEKRKQILILLNNIESTMRMNDKRKSEQKWLFWKYLYKFYLKYMS